MGAGGPAPSVRSRASKAQRSVARPQRSFTKRKRSPGAAYDSQWLRRLLSINKRLNSELRLPRLHGLFNVVARLQRLVFHLDELNRLVGYLGGVRSHERNSDQNPSKVLTCTS